MLQPTEPQPPEIFQNDFWKCGWIDFDRGYFFILDWHRKLTIFWQLKRPRKSLIYITTLICFGKCSIALWPKEETAGVTVWQITVAPCERGWSQSTALRTRSRERWRNCSFKVSPLFMHPVQRAILQMQPLANSDRTTVWKGIELESFFFPTVYFLCLNTCSLSYPIYL